MHRKPEVEMDGVHSSKKKTIQRHLDPKVLNAAYINGLLIDRHFISRLVDL